MNITGSSGTLDASYDLRADWTAQPQQPAPDPLLRLVVHGPASYQVNDLDRFAAWIIDAGFQQIAARSPSECVRFVRGRQLIVAYANGTLLLQGQQFDITRALLNQLAGGV